MVWGIFVQKDIKEKKMIQGRKVYDPLTNTWSTGYWVRDDHGNWYPVWAELRRSRKGN